MASILLALALKGMKWGLPLDQHGALIVQKGLYVIVLIDFHPHMAGRDTILERLDERPLFKEQGRAEILQRISGTLGLEALMSAHVTSHEHEFPNIRPVSQFNR